MDADPTRRNVGGNARPWTPPATHPDEAPTVSRAFELLAIALAGAAGAALAALIVDVSLVVVIPAAVGVALVAAILVPGERVAREERLLTQRASEPGDPAT
jgi:hypothetical protein